MSSPIRKFILKLILLSVPVLIWVLWQISLPMNQYTFRGWEALIAGSPKWRPGFFPNQKLTMNEVGDLAPYTINAVPHPVKWETDSEGYRNAADVCGNPEVVVIGDSMAMGASLSQEDTLSAQLGRDLSQCVRSYAGGKLHASMNWVYQKQLNPQWVIIVLAERNTHVVEELRKFSFERRLDWLDHVPNTPIVRWSHFLKKFYWNYRGSHGIYEAVKRSFITPEQATSVYAPRLNAPNPPSSELLFFGNIWNEGDDEAKILELKQILENFSDQIKTRHAQLLVTFVPNKESIYYEKQGKPEPQLYKKLNESLTSSKFVYLDLITLFKKNYQENHQLLHQSDDTHWNREGVQILSRAIRDQIKK